MTFSEWSNNKKKREEANKASSTTSPLSFSEWSNKKHGITESERTFTVEGTAGWQKYLADEEAAKNAPKYDLNKDGKDAWWEKLLGYLGGNGGGVVDTTLPTAGVTQTVHDLRADVSYQRPNDDWTEGQKNAFGELYMSSPLLAYNYAAETNKKNAQAKEEEALKQISADASSNFLSGLGHTAGAIATAPLGMADFLYDLALANAGREIAPDGQVSPFEYSQAVTGGIAKDLNETYGTLPEDWWVVGGKGVGDVYGLGTSIAQSAVTGLTLGSAGTLISYFGQGAASGVDEALSRGATEEQAVLYGTALGTFEGVAEMIGIDNLFKIGSSATVKEAVKNVLRQAGAEGLEEMFTAIASEASDRIIMGDKSNFNLRVNELMAQGMSESEAQKKAWMEVVGDVAYDTLGGFVSGGVHAGAYTGIQTTFNNAQNKKYFGDQAQAMVNEAAASENADVKAVGGKYQAKLNDGKKLSGWNISELLEVTDTAKVKSAIAAKLTQLGEQGDVSQLADILTKQAQGVELTKREQNILDNSKYGQRVANTLDPENIKSGKYDTKWAENIGTRRFNAQVYNKSLYDLAKQVSSALDASEKNAVAESEADIENEAGTKFKASTNGKTTYTDAKGKTRDVTVKRIASTEGEINVELEDGTTVKASDLNFGTKEEALMYEMVARMEASVGTANEIIGSFKPSNMGQASKFFTTVPLAYQYGKMGYETGLKNIDINDSLKKIVYDLGRKDAKSQDKVKTAKGGTKSETKKGGIIFEGGYVYNESEASDIQKASMGYIEAIDKMSSLEVHVFESIVKDGERVYFVDGEYVKAPNGYFVDGNKIYIDINAGNGGEGAMLHTAAHEIAHFIREWNAKGFREIGDFLLKEYGKRGVPVQVLLNEQKEKIKKRYEKESKALPSEAKLADMAYEELVCDAMSEMLADEKAYEKLAKLKQKDRTLWAKLGEAIKAVLGKLKGALDIYSKYAPDSKEADFVRGFDKKTFEKLQDLYLKAFVEADANYGAAKDSTTEGTSEAKYSYSSIAYSFFGDENISIKDMESGAYKKTEGYKQYVDQCLNNMRQSVEGFSEKAALKEITDSIDGIVQVAVAMKKAGYDILDSEGGRSIRDSKKRLLFSSLEPNSDYFTSSDISTICDKRINFAEIYDEIVRREDAMGVPKNKRFFNNIDNYFVLHKILADKGLTAPCRQCYVESMRKNLDPMANAFIELMQETDPNNKANNQLYQPSGKNKGELKSNNAKLRENLLEVIEREQYDITADKLTIKMLTTADGLAQLKLQAPLIYEAFNSFYGQSKPKMPKAATPFRFGELTALLTDDKGRIKKGLVEKIKSTGGFRLQSYSDFQIQNFADVLQVIFEAGTLGLNGHAYTKVPAFLDATKGTNLKRNISIFMYKDGGEWKIDRGDSFPLELQEIYDIVDADESGNTGIIAVVQNEDMAAWIMANNNVGYFIPFHKSGVKMGVVRETIVREGGREIKGYSGIKDHTRQQTEVWSKTTSDHKALTKVKKGINIYEFWDFDNVDNLSQKELIEKNVMAYIDACNEAGYLPKFREYVMNNGKVLNKVLAYAKELGLASQNATIEDISFEYSGYRIPYGYYKCLVDFGVFTPDGEASPIERLSLKDYKFNEAVKFFSDAETLRRNEILQQFENGFEREKYRKRSDMTTAELVEEVQKRRNQVVDEVVSGEYKKKKYSDRVLMGSLFSGGGTLEAGLVYQMVDKEFAVEYNKKIASVYTDNHGKEHMFVGDVRDFDSKEKQNVFYLHASPVCKNFSPASHSGGETSLDITTAQATARVLEEQMPQVFTVENVKRYIDSEAYNIITNKLNELGYTWDVDVYKASDYGNATKRERMIIRAVRDGQLPAKPQKASTITSWGEATRDLWETDLIPSTLVKSKIEAIRNTPELKNLKISKLDKPLMIYDTTKSKKITYAWADELAPTLTTKCGDARIIMPDGRVYAPTPKFMGRIQGLPDNYKYPKANTNAFKIIGNGIPTQLTKAVMGGVLDSAYEQTHDGQVLYSDRDSSYMDAVNRGDMVTAQRMVDEAAYTKNYVVAGYHGTPNGGFTKFGGHKTRNGANAAGSYWFSEELNHANVYKSYPQNYPAAENPMVYNVYLDVGNWADIGNGRVEALDYSIDGKGAATKELRAVAKAIAFKTQYMNRGKSEATRARNITQQLVEIGRNIYADFIWQITETQEFADLCKQEGLDSVVAWEEHKEYNSNGERETHMVKTYGVFSPEQIKSADPVTYDDNGNVIPLSERFNIKNNDIRYSDRTSYAPTFYSYMGKVVDGIRLEKMGASGVVSYLKGKGVKDEEIKWSGIETFLEGKKSVTKAELQEFVAGSQLVVEEEISDPVTQIDLRKGGETDDYAYILYDKDGNVLDRFSYDYAGELESEKTGETFLDVETLEEEIRRDSDHTRWSQYKLEGGENYRELIFKLPKSSYTNRAMRVHWGQDTEGVLVHARIQDFDVNGKKMLFVEELQSDWHNEGHAKGYTTKEYEDAVAVYDKLAEDYANKRRAFNKYVRSGEFRSDPDDVSKKKFDWLRRKMDEAEKRMQEAERDVEALKEKGMGDVPDAPFRDNYHEYVLKRLLRMAAEEGYDSIGWTPSWIQSERWSEDFAEAYRIEYDQEMPKFLRKYGKKWGATVGKAEVGVAERTVNGEHYDAENIEVWSMDITDSMKDSVLNEGQVLYSLRDVEPVTPTSDKWERTLTTAEVKAQFPQLWDVSADESEVRNPTQISGTVKSYRKVYDFLKAEGFNGTILDASSGLGYGTRAGIEEYGFKVDDIEPYPDKNYKPKYKDYSKLTKKYDVIISNAVLNVIPQDQRDALVVKMGELLKDGGRMFINVRGDDVRNASSKVAINEGLMEYYISQSGSYQKGFTKTELVAYLEDALGEGFTVKPISWFGKTSAIVTKSDIRFSDRDPDSVSNRSLLANALESVAQHEVEKKRLEEYKGRIALLEAEQKKLGEIRAKANELRFKKGRTAEETQQLREFDAEANKVANRINFHDKKLLELEATKALKGVLQREKENLRKRLNQKNREAVKEATEGRYKTAARHKIQNLARELDGLLNKGTKERNVKNGERAIVRRALDLSEMLFATDDELLLRGLEVEYTDAEASAMDDYMALYEEYHSYDDAVTENKEKRKELRSQMNDIKKEFADALERERKRISKAKASDTFDALIAEYEKLASAEEEHLRLAYKPEVLEHIKALKANVGDALVSEMTLEQLTDVYKAFKMIKTMVADSNKIFRKGKMESREERKNAIFRQIGALKNRFSKDYPGAIGKALNKINEFGWNNLRPVDAFELMDSEALTELFWDVIDAQSVYAKDIEEVKEAIVKARQKYGYKTWKLDKTESFKTADGRTFTITLGEKLSIYAYSKRDQADAHMREGGFQHVKGATYKDSKGVIRLRTNESLTYRVDDKMRFEIIDSLTKEQQAYATEVQELLTAWGEKGNEASRILYGIDLFNEEIYFPLKSSHDFLPSVQTEIGQTATTASLAGSGMTKPTKPKANNPIILQAFDDVVLDHFDRMSKYHAYVVPIDNLRKMLDAQGLSSSDDMMSLKALIGEKLGTGAKEYLQNYITDLNGSASVSGAKNPLESFFGKAKGASVSANLSVWVQQYFSVIRAFSMVNPRYFIPFMGEQHTKGDMKAYEEMKKYAPIATIKEMGGFDVGSNKGINEYIGYEEAGLSKGKVSKGMQDAFGIGANLMDKLGWTTIWKGIKKEVAASGKYKVGSKEYLEACGKRFEEVIVKTQVYDSVNSRSGYMRSKSGTVKYLVSFMGEPTTIVGMAEVAVIKLERAIQSKNKDAIKKASAGLVATMSSVAISTALTSIAKSLVYAMRDEDEDETYPEKYAEALAKAFKDDINLLNYLPVARDIASVFEGRTIERPDMTLIEDAIDSYLDLKESLGDEDALAEEKIEDGIALAGAIANIFGIPAKNIWRDLSGLVNTMLGIGNEYDTDFGRNFVEGWTGEEAKKGDNLYSAIVNGDTKRVEYYKSSYKTESAFNSAVSEVLREHYEAGEISDYEAENMLVEYGGKSYEDAASKVQYWEFKKKYPDYDLSEEAVKKYYNEVEPSGIGIGVYYDYSKQRAKCKGTDNDGDGKTDSGSVKAEVLYIIDSLPITNEQKDALYYLNGWAASTLWQAPWH